MARAARKRAAPRGAGVPAGSDEMWVRFLRDCDFTPPEDRRVTWARKAGDTRSLRRVHAEALIANGDAEEIAPPRRADPQT